MPEYTYVAVTEGLDYFKCISADPATTYRSLRGLKAEALVSTLQQRLGIWEVQAEGHPKMLFIPENFSQVADTPAEDPLTVDMCSACGKKIPLKEFDEHLIECWKKHPKIEDFSGKYRFLSNFFLVGVEYEELTYSSTEHAYQAAKTLDPELRKKFAVNEDSSPITPSEAKRLGQQLKLRDDWEEVKVSVMDELLAKKFAHQDLRQRLLNTGISLLVEGNTWHDLFWGVCYCKKHSGRGQNHLGHLLMRVRSTLKGT